MTTRMFTVGCLLVAALSAGMATAQQPARTVAKLTGVAGGVLVSQAAAMAAATGEQRLAPGARVITTAGGSATILYDQGCSVRLPENRTYTVRERGDCTAAKEPPLGKAGDFAVLGGTAVVNTGASVVTGDVGVSPGTGVTGFPPGRVVNGSIHSGDEAAKQAQTDAGKAYDQLVAMECNVDLSGQNLGGLTLTPGVYCVTGAPARLSGELVLDTQGDPNAVFVFQMGAGLVTDAGSVVREKNGGAQAKANGNGKPAGNGNGNGGARPLACSVFWQVAGATALGKDSRFFGNAIGSGPIDVAAGSDVVGRLLARTGQVTLDTDKVEPGVCPPIVPVVPPITGSGGAAGGGAAAGGAAAGAATGAAAIAGGTWVVIGAGAIAIGAAINNSNKTTENPTPN